MTRTERNLHMGSPTKDTPTGTLTYSEAYALAQKGAQFQFASPYPNCKEAAYEHWIVREIVDGGLASKYAYFYLPTL